MKIIRIVIVEDEAATARNLAYLLNKIDKDLILVITLHSVGEGVEWFAANTDAYDLVFMDIRLADGLSFDIFNQVEIARPVIFVTAYNDYALQAFKNNGIDYILKPFDEQEVTQALTKYKTWLSSPPVQPEQPLLAFIAEFQKSNQTYKKSFLVHYRDKMLPIEVAKIAWFYTAHEIVYANMTDGRQFVMEFTMEQLDHQLDPQIFFRANRQFIVNRNMIAEIEFYFNGRLSVKIKPVPPELILISKARAPEFKSWINS